MELHNARGETELRSMRPRSDHSVPQSDEGGEGDEGDEDDEDEYVPVHVVPSLVAATATVLPDKVAANVVPSVKEPLAPVPLIVPVPV